MMADGKFEIRFEIPADDLAVLDAYCNSTGKGRTSVIASLLADWTKAKRHEAIVICRTLQINPMSSDEGRK